MAPPLNDRRRRLARALRRIVRLRELGPKTPRWSRAWKRLLWRYERELNKEEDDMLPAKEFRPGRAFLGRFPEGCDIGVSLTEFCRREGVLAGWISAVGTVRSAVLGYFEQGNREYLRLPVEEEMEIISCQGNVSLLEGEPFVHLHVALSGRDGETICGHLFESQVFVGEFWLQELLGPALERRPDAPSGLSLWDLTSS